VKTALLVQYYDQLTEVCTKETGAGDLLHQAALEEFRQRVASRYAEATLVRLATSPDRQARRSAILALGLLGTMNVNTTLAARLHDEDEDVTRLAADSLWLVWFRGSTPENCDELRRILRLRDRQRALEALNHLIERDPEFAEAFNQRAILYFRLEQYERSIADCEEVLKRNPCHFGAHAGMGQCLLKLRKQRPALKAFKAALRLYPTLDGIAETVRSLESALGEEGRRDDKK
jgi:tetratricopeptide (TPR) repeat protein